jgi:SAM-dependent methyltransferase
LLFVKDISDHLVYYLFEKPRGLDFARNCYPYGDNSQNVWYERTNRRHIREIFSFFRDRSLPVLDIGCGKGYLLYRLQKMGFAHTDGIEYNAELARIARGNLRRLKLDSVRVFEADARKFDGYDAYSVVYLFHPFRGGVMAETVKRLEESLRRVPRKFYAVYLFPKTCLPWEQSDFFRRVHSRQIEFANASMDVFYYMHDPDDLPPPRPSFRDFLRREMGRSN